MSLKMLENQLDELTLFTFMIEKLSGMTYFALKDKNKARECSPLALKLFMIPGIKEIEFMDGTLTVKGAFGESSAFGKEMVFETVTEHLESDDLILFDDYDQEVVDEAQEEEIKEEKMAISVYSEITPNPSTLKFIIDKEIVENPVDVSSLEEAKEKSPMALELFAITDVSGVYIGRNFVTITKSSNNTWQEYEDAIITCLKDFLSEGKNVVNKGVGKVVAADYTETEKKIIEVIEEEIRPAVAMDGGDIVFKAYEDGIVYLQMLGACSGCPSSTATLKMGVEMRLKEVVPEIEEVVQV
ncbi:NifU N-terminal domain-containing protein [bacterium]|nr:NifU N-terminal domain-containing protein [bacterium]